MKALSKYEKGGRVTQAKQKLMKTLYANRVPLYYRQNKNGRIDILKTNPVKQLKIIPTESAEIISPVLKGFTIKLALVSKEYPKDLDMKKTEVELWNRNHSETLIDAIVDKKLFGLELNLDLSEASLLTEQVSLEQELLWKMKSAVEKEAMLNFLASSGELLLETSIERDIINETGLIEE